MNTLKIASFWTTLSELTTTLAAIATILYVYFTYKILRETSNTSKLQVKIADAQIYYQVTKILNSEESNKLFESLEKGSFNIVTFENTQTIRLQTTILSSDLQRLILDPIEDLAKYWRDGLISLDSIDTGFGFKILAVGSNIEIINYIKGIRETFKSIRPYEGFEEIYLEIRKLISDEEKLQYPNHFDI
jgi:hypothetical protein